MGRLRDRLTFANVVSVVSLLLALGVGTAWAAQELSKNDVRSRHIAKGQVKTPDLAKSAVTSAKVKNGSLLGKDFSLGQFPAPGIETAVTISANENVDSHDVTAKCPLGKKAVGGGGGWAVSDVGNEIALERSEPTPELDGWTVRARRIGAGEWALRADAVCMDASP